MSINKFYNLAKYQLYPICRSLTGKGNRKTLSIIKSKFPSLKILKILSGKKVYDWKVPSEWNVSDAYVIDKDNEKIIDFKKNNLHLIGYSISINKNLKKKDLLSKIKSLPTQPLAIPYATSYYKSTWGFCASHKQKKNIEKNYLKNDTFKAVIKSSLNKSGKMNYGELVLQGKSKQEILVSTYICHPSMANNELSGPIVSMCLIDYFKKQKNLSKTIRFIFIPETIGSIGYIEKNLTHLKKNVVGGYNLSCIGDERQHSCMFTKYNNTTSDRALVEAYKKLKIKYKIYSFLKRGSDERQYNSPGVDLPIASIFRSKYGEYSEYHTSLDDFSLVTKKGIYGGFSVAKEAIKILLNKEIPKAKYLCEPQMGKRGLYSNLSIKGNRKASIQSMVDFLQYSDGKNDISNISKIIGINLSDAKRTYRILKKNNLLD